MALHRIVIMNFHFRFHLLLLLSLSVFLSHSHVQSKSIVVNVDIDIPSPSPSPSLSPPYHYGLYDSHLTIPPSTLHDYIESHHSHHYAHVKNRPAPSKHFFHYSNVGDNENINNDREVIDDDGDGLDDRVKSLPKGHNLNSHNLHSFGYHVEFHPHTYHLHTEKHNIKHIECGAVIHTLNGKDDIHTITLHLHRPNIPLFIAHHEDYVPYQPREHFIPRGSNIIIHADHYHCDAYDHRIGLGPGAQFVKLPIVRKVLRSIQLQHNFTDNDVYNDDQYTFTLIVQKTTIPHVLKNGNFHLSSTHLDHIPSLRNLIGNDVLPTDFHLLNNRPVTMGDIHSGYVDKIILLTQMHHLNENLLMSEEEREARKGKDQQGEWDTDYDDEDEDEYDHDGVNLIDTDPYSPHRQGANSMSSLSSSPPHHSPSPSSKCSPYLTYGSSSTGSKPTRSPSNDPKIHHSLGVFGNSAGRPGGNPHLTEDKGIFDGPNPSASVQSNAQKQAENDWDILEKYLKEHKIDYGAQCYLEDKSGGAMVGYCLKCSQCETMRGKAAVDSNHCDEQYPHCCVTMNPPGATKPFFGIESFLGGYSVGGSSGVAEQIMSHAQGKHESHHPDGVRSVAEKKADAVARQQQYYSPHLMPEVQWNLQMDNTIHRRLGSGTLAWNTNARVLTMPMSPTIMLIPKMGKTPFSLSCDNCYIYIQLAIGFSGSVTLSKGVNVDLVLRLSGGMRLQFDFNVLNSVKMLSPMEGKKIFSWLQSIPRVIGPITIQSGLDISPTVLVDVGGSAGVAMGMQGQYTKYVGYHIKGTTITPMTFPKQENTFSWIPPQIVVKARILSIGGIKLAISTVIEGFIDPVVYFTPSVLLMSEWLAFSDYPFCPENKNFQISVMPMLSWGVELKLTLGSLAKGVEWAEGFGVVKRAEEWGKNKLPIGVRDFFANSIHFAFPDIILRPSLEYCFHLLSLKDLIGGSPNLFHWGKAIKQEAVAYGSLSSEELGNGSGNDHDDDITNGRITWMDDHRLLIHTPAMQTTNNRTDSHCVIKFSSIVDSNITITPQDSVLVLTSPPFSFFPSSLSPSFPSLTITPVHFSQTHFNVITLPTCYSGLISFIQYMNSHVTSSSHTDGLIDVDNNNDNDHNDDDHFYSDMYDMKFNDIITPQMMRNAKEIHSKIHDNENHPWHTKRDNHSNPEVADKEAEMELRVVNVRFQIRESAEYKIIVKMVGEEDNTTLSKNSALLNSLIFQIDQIPQHTLTSDPSSQCLDSLFVASHAIWMDCPHRHSLLSGHYVQLFDENSVASVTVGMVGRKEENVKEQWRKMIVVELVKYEDPYFTHGRAVKIQ